MAKAIKDAAGNITGYEPGIIYDLGFYDPETNIRYPFYVGETTNKVQRYKTHIREGVSPAPDAEDKYHFIKQLNDRNLKWDIQDLAAYGNEGPADLEDEWVMKYLFDGITLTNMVRGSDRWIKNMEDREKVSADMKRRGISSYRKYKEILTDEERERQRQEKHAEWLRQEEAKKYKEHLKARSHYLKQLYDMTYLSSLEACLENCPYDFDEALIKHVRTTVAYNEKRAKAHDRYMVQQERARQERKQIEEEMNERRAEQVREAAERAKREAKLKEERNAQWEADRPAREARLRAEAEAREAAEAKRLKELRERKQQEEAAFQREIQDEVDRICKQWAEEGRPDWMLNMDSQKIIEQHFYEEAERKKQQERNASMLGRSANPVWQRLAVDLINAKKPLIKYCVSTTLADPFYIERQQEIKTKMENL